jgi:SAM-dependent methyltransferase
LKDASAWNVLFSGARPVFCDLLSFVPLRERNWWALGQFVRHFVLPLLLSRRRGLRSHQSFARWRDGMPPESARRMMGWTRYLGRHWPLMASASSQAARPEAVVADPAGPAVLAELGRFRSGLNATLAWWLRGATPRRRDLRQGPWSSYTQDRTHYEGDSVERKRLQVAEWLEWTRPDWVADLGCNTGEFSRLAMASGAQVVAVDGDHDSIEQLFLSSPAAGLYPVIAVLDDMKGGAGWQGDEYPGLAQRLEQTVDLVMMLALVHHLAVAASIPLEEVARMAHRMSRRWLIVEFVAPEDRQMQLLCRQRKRDPQDFGVARQRAAFLDAGFELVAELDLAPAPRTLALLKTRG